MGKVETKPLQLGLGEKIVGKKEISRGVIRQNEFVVAPSEKGHCNARLAQKEAEIERVKDCEIEGLSGWRIADVIHVEKNISGNWNRWPIPKGSIIGVYSKNVRGRKKEITIIVKKDPVFLPKRF